MMETRRPKVKRYQTKKIAPGRSIKRTVVERRKLRVEKKRPKRQLRRQKTLRKKGGV